MKKELEIIEELIKTGQLEVEPLYYTIQKGREENNIKRGKVYRCLKTKQYIYFVDHNDFVYKPGDYVYVESNRCDQPYYVANVQTFKMAKRGDQLNVVLNWFYRPCQLPEAVYHTLVQDRRLEENFALFFKDSLIPSREIFVSDVVNLLPVSSIRGKCIVRHFKDVPFRTTSTLTAAATTSASRGDDDDDDDEESKKLLLIDDDTFFYILGYNAENKTLANIQGEIRVGSSYQARLPDYNSPKYVDEYLQRSTETLQWSPDRMAESDLLMYISAARSIAIAGASTTASTNNNVDDDSNDDHGCLAAAQDQTTINALISLHDNNYEAGRALQQFIKTTSTTLSIDKKWTDEETKKFVRGLKQYGKNFFKIRKEFLPHKETCHLVEFYYVWKKTEAASNQRPRQRQRRPPTNILKVKKVKTTSAKQNRLTSNEFVDFSSASENELETDNVDGKATLAYACHHCYSTTSKDWHHGGKDKALLCTDCRIYYKKYGELRQLDRQRTPPSFLFKSSVKDSSDDGGVKTRRSNKDQQRKPLTPTSVDCRMDDATLTTPSKSPDSLSSTGSRSDEKPSAKKGKKRKSEPTDDVDDEVSLAKHKAKYLSKDKFELNQNSNGDFASSSTSVDSESQDNSSMSSSPDESLPSTSFDAKLKSTDNDANEQRNVIVKCETVAENVNNIYNFVDHDDPFAKSMAGLRRQLTEIRQNDSKFSCPPIMMASPSTSNETRIISTTTTPASGGVIKEIGKFVKEEPKDVSYGNERDQNISNVIKEPEPKIDDTEHHRSKNAIFRRHWYRGESNSCSRTDLVFIPLPDSAWAKKREQRMKNQAENKEKQIKQEQPVPKLQSTSRLNVPQSSPHQSGPNSGSMAFIPSMTSSNSFAASTPGPPSLTPVPTPASSKEQTPALQRLKELAMSGAHGTAPLQQFFPGSSADPSLPNRILSGQYGSYEKEKLEFEIRERHKEKLQSQFFGQELRSSVPPGNFPFFSLGPNVGFPGVDPRQWMAAQQNGHFTPVNSSANGLPPLIQTGANLDPVIVERLLATLSAERVHLERLLAVNPNPMLRLELDKVTAQLAAVAGTQHHTHSHTHSHTHLHIHPTTGVPMLNDEIADVRSWPPHPAMVNQEMLLHQYASMFRANPNMDPNLIGLHCLPGPQFGLGPQVGLEHLAAERLQQLQQQEMHRRIMMEREHMIAAQHQSIVQHNEMMRRLHDEGNGYAGSSSSRPSASMIANEMSLPPFDKR